MAEQQEVIKDHVKSLAETTLLVNCLNSLHRNALSQNIVIDVLWC